MIELLTIILISIGFLITFGYLKIAIWLVGSLVVILLLLLDDKFYNKKNTRKKF